MKESDQSDWQGRARRVLAGGVNSQFRSADPVVFTRGHGSHIWDLAGQEFIDYTLSQGPLIHGHSRPEILTALSESMSHGQIWNGLHTREIELAEQLVEIIPCADSIRLGCTGSEAVQAALRLARAFTGRPKVIKFEGHYHGWLDSVAASINPSLETAGPDQSPHAVPWTGGMSPGALDGLVVAPWNDLSAISKILRAHDGSIAAIITEPCMCNSGCVEPTPGYLAGLRDLCDRHHALLIFDEIITGFRLALGGAQQYYEVTPDLAIFGKAIAGGFPLSVIAGRAAVMQAIADGRAIHAGTLNAHVGCVAAALASLQLLRADPATHSKLHNFGIELKKQLESIARSLGMSVFLTGPGSVFHMGFLRSGSSDTVTIRNYRDVARSYDVERYAAFVRGMAKRGIRLIGRGIWYISTAHTQLDMDQTVDAARLTLKEMA